MENTENGSMKEGAEHWEILKAFVTWCLVVLKNRFNIIGKFFYFPHSDIS